MRYLQLLFAVACISLAFISCERAETRSEVEFNGRTMGTFYQIKYIGEPIDGLQSKIDSVLKEVNQSMSVYIEQSVISEFNTLQDTTEWFPVDRHFQIVFMESLDAHQKTGGAFDPTVMPLVNYWGFGFTDKLENISLSDSLTIDSLKRNVGLQQIDYQFVRDGELFLRKTAPDIMLDFGAIAKGYGVDAVCWFFESLDIHDYMVEIGGEVRAKGKNRHNQIWKIGIEEPEDKDIDSRELFAILNLDHKAMATSGNYRNYREIDGQILAHIINPFTGFPEKSDILSVTIVTDNTMQADAYATAAMVLNSKQTIELASRQHELEVFLIYLDELGQVQTYISSGLEDYLEVL